VRRWSVGHHAPATCVVASPGPLNSTAAGRGAYAAHALSDAALVHDDRLLTSMPGVGSLLACTLIALLPELGRMNRKQVAAPVGVAPYAFESGTLKGRRCTGAVVRTSATCSIWRR
jgi:transposase